MSEQTKLSRRDFIKGAAAVSAGVATAGLLTNTAQAAPGVPDKWDKETDVVVVGSGGTGLAAAIEAADAGAQVIIVEKADHVGGLFIAAGGHAILGATHVQKRNGIQDTLDMWFEDEMKESDYRAIPEIVRAYVDKGPEFALWMESLGLKWSDTLTANPGHRVNRGTWAAPSPDYPGGYPAQTAGISWITVLKRKVDKQGTPILLKHRMTRLFRPDPNGPVVGVEANNEGKVVNIKARKGIVLAAGSVTDNAQMCAAQDPRVGDLYSDGYGPPGTAPYIESTGDALDAGLAIGAGLADMSFLSFYSVKWGSKVYWVWEPRDWTKLPKWNSVGNVGVPLSGKGFQRVILVKNDGARYINEMEGAATTETGGGFQENPELAFSRLFLNLKERPRNVWAITDADGAAALNWSLDVLQNPDPTVSPALYPDCVAVAQTLQELATKMKIPGANLEETVRKYNGFVDAGKDADFGKPAPMFKLAKAPFVGVKLCMMRHTDQNGLRINSKAQVLDRSAQMELANKGLPTDTEKNRPVPIDQEKVIPHLYAAGEDAAFMGWRRTHGRLGICCIFGRIAGKNAAGETPSV